MSFLYFLDKLASFQWLVVDADELVVELTHNIFHAHDNKWFMSTLITISHWLNKQLQWIITQNSWPINFKALHAVGNAS